MMRKLTVCACALVALLLLCSDASAQGCAPVYGGYGYAPSYGYAAATVTPSYYAPSYGYAASYYAPSYYYAPRYGLARWRTRLVGGGRRDRSASRCLAQDHFFFGRFSPA